MSIDLSDLERGELGGLSRRRRTAQGLARRAQIVLAAAEGLENKQIAARLGSDPTIRRTLEERPPDAPHWSLRGMVCAREPGGDQPVPQRRKPDAKRPSTRPSRNGRTSPLRLAWRVRQPALTPEQLVVIDETWATTAMARRYGRARRGRRLVAAVPHGHWKTTTFLAALRHNRITAPCVFDGAINGERFRAYVDQALAPTLGCGDVVVSGSLRSPDGCAVRRW